MDTNRDRAKAGRRPSLYRGADGKLRPDKGDYEIADVWAQQRRIKLAEELAEKQKQANLRRLRRDHGLVGLTKFYINEAIIRTRIQLFGIDSINKQPPEPPPAKRKASRAPAAQPSQRFNNAAAQITSGLDNLKTRLAALPRKAVIAAGIVSLVAVGGVLVAASQQSGDKPADKASAKQSGQNNKANQPAGLQPGTPDYPTITPGGKDVSQFGGWKRVSPQGKDPVFAYADKLAGTNIAVSQQPLPADFKRSTASKIAELAKNFSANETLDAAGTTVYIGTSAKGPQSIIFSKDDLLVLIKSDQIIKDSDWTTYITSLRQ